METFRSFIYAPWITNSMTVLKPPPISSFQSLVDCPMVSNSCSSLYCQEYCMSLPIVMGCFLMNGMWVGLYMTSEQLFQRGIKRFYQVSHSFLSTVQMVSSKEGLPISLGPGILRHFNSIKTAVAATNTKHKQD